MKTIAQRISKIASRAQTEEDLKIGVETVIREYLVEQSDIEIIPEYEKITGIRGRRDAVYGHFTIEYKKPGELENQNRLKRAAIQLAGYLEDVKIDNGKGEEALKRVAGACIDGKKIFFLRYWPSNIGRSRSSSLIETYSEGIHGGFQLMGPYPVTPESIDELFRYMRALHRRPLSPEYLAGEFGPGTETAQFIVGALYQSFANKESETVKTLFKQWEYTFGIVYGAETVKARSDIPELAKGYGLPKEVSLKHSLFAVHTYFALIMKLIAAEVVSLQQGSLAPSLIGQLSGMAPAELENQMNQLEDGGIFKAYGIKNFLEGDFFRWYLSVWDGELAKAIRLLASKLSGFEPTTPFLRPGEARDLLKKLYQYLVPKKLRHDLGEYYTPDWIAERLLNQLSYHGNPNTRILDPACGSGTFLTLAIDRVRRYMQDHFWDRDPSKRKECAAKILRNIVGFDLNPLAVIAARTNFLLVFGDLIRDIRPIEIPVYMCDSILPPVLQKKAQQRQMSILDEKDQNYFYLPTSAGEFIMPKEVLDKKILEQITHAIEDCIRLKFTPEEFLTWVENEGVLEKKGSYELLKRLYAQIMDLEAKVKTEYGPGC